MGTVVQRQIFGLPAPFRSGRDTVINDAGRRPDPLFANRLPDCRKFPRPLAGSEHDECVLAPQRGRLPGVWHVFTPIRTSRNRGGERWTLLDDRVMVEAPEFRPGFWSFCILKREQPVAPRWRAPPGGQRRPPSRRSRDRLSAGPPRSSVRGSVTGLGNATLRRSRRGFELRRPGPPGGARHFRA